MSRYPAPTAESIWSKVERANRMREISDEYTTEAILAAGKPELLPGVYGAQGVSIAAWEQAEAESGHEIVGFLQAYLIRLPVRVHQFVHLGLTSSDLVEYDQHQSRVLHASSMAGFLDGLINTLECHIANPPSNNHRAGRTHGRTAERTDLAHQLRTFHWQARRITDAMVALAEQQADLIKSPGPTGFGPRTAPPGFRPVSSTQVMPRDLMFEWVSLYLRVANLLDSLATFIRLGSRSEIDEFSEGGARGRIGSSAMPGKRNPITSERVCGLARIARGYGVALLEVSNLWEDRDLTNSSTERIAVPELAATVEYMTRAMALVVHELEIDWARINQNALDPAAEANHRQTKIQIANQVGPIEAGRIEQGGKA